MGLARQTLDERFWSKVNREGPGPLVKGVEGRCWVWTASLHSEGYGQIKVEGKVWKAHRVAWVLTHGALDDDLVIDHLCRNRKCANPAHLEPVTNRVNILRGEVGARARRPVCAAGHEHNDQNTRIDPKGFRRCRACDRDNSARYRATT